MGLIIHLNLFNISLLDIFELHVKLFVILSLLMTFIKCNTYLINLGLYPTWWMVWNFLGSDVPPNPSRDPKVCPRMQQWKKKRVGARSLIRNTLKFGGRRVWWSSETGLRWIHKWEFKMISTYTMNKKRWLVQIKWKWCDGLNNDNLKHKLHMAHKFWEEASLPSL
jgi:hypothetical protein